MTSHLDGSTRIQPLLFAGILSSNIGNAAHVILLSKYLFDATNEATTFGGALSFEQIIAVVASILAIPFIDRINPIQSVVCAEVARGVLVTAMGVITFFNTSLTPLYFMILFIQFGRPFYKSGLFAAEVDLIPESVRANYNSQSASAGQIGSFLGMWLAGLLISMASIRWGFILNGLSFFASAYFTRRATQGHAVTRVAKQSRRLGEELKSAFHLFVRERKIRWALIFSAIDFALPQAFNVLLVPLVFERFKNQPFWISAIDSSFAIGAFVSGVFIGRAIHRWGVRFGVFVGLGLQAAGLALLTLSGSSWIVLGSMLLGVANMMSWTAWQTWFQAHTSRGERGKFSIVRHLITSVLTVCTAYSVSQITIFGLNYAIMWASSIALFGIIGSSVLFFSEKTEATNVIAQGVTQHATRI